MDPTHKSDLLWGAIGALSFLVLVQGYHLLRGDLLALRALALATLFVFAVSAAGAHLLRPRLVRRFG